MIKVAAAKNHWRLCCIDAHVQFIPQPAHLMRRVPERLGRLFLRLAVISVDVDRPVFVQALSPDWFFTLISLLFNHWCSLHMLDWHWVEHVEKALLPNIIIRKPNSTTIGGVPDRHNVLVSYSGSGRALRAASTPWSGCRRSAPRPLRSARARNHQRSVAGQCRPAELI